MKASRLEEGKKLEEDISKRIEKISKILEKIDKNKEKIYEKMKEKVINSAKKLKIYEENPLVLNEITFLLQRMDINEEVVRLKSHISKLKEILKDEEIGRKLEFLCQEIHREINTLSSKLPHFWEEAVEIKTEVDKIKQQASNVV